MQAPMYSDLCTGCVKDTMQRNLCMQAEVLQSVTQDYMIVLSMLQVGPIITEPIAATWAPSVLFVFPHQCYLFFLELYVEKCVQCITMGSQQLLLCRKSLYSSTKFLA